MLVFLCGFGVILFSQIKFSTGQQIAATVMSIGTAEGVTGKEVYLIVKTDNDVTAKIAGKEKVAVGDRVTLDIFNRFIFRDVYSLE